MSQDNGAAAVSAEPELVVFVSPARTVLSGLHLITPDSAPARRIKRVHQRVFNKCASRSGKQNVWTPGETKKVSGQLVNQIFPSA